MKKRITKKQLEIMKILWSSDKPLIASEILKRNDSLNINTVQACLRALVNKQFIKVADIVYSGTVLTRSYTPPGYYRESKSLLTHCLSDRYRNQSE